MSSKKITKSIAESAACELLKEVEVKITSLRNELSDYVIEEAIKTVGNDLYIKIKELPSGWVGYQSYLLFVSEGCGSQGVNLNKKILWKANYTVAVSKEVIEVIKNKLHFLNKTRDQKNALYNQIVETLMKLQTFNKIKESYPEAYAVIPPKIYLENNVVSLPINSIKETINNIINK